MALVWTGGKGTGILLSSGLELRVLFLSVGLKNGFDSVC